MLSPHDVKDLDLLAQKITTEDIHKVLLTTRRLRGVLNGKFIFDTTRAYQLWEHQYYPHYYIPISALTQAAEISRSTDPIPGSSNAYNGTLTAVNSKGERKSTDRILIFSKHDQAALDDTIRIEFSALSAWFEEDVQIYGPKNPFTRVDILPSSRRVKVVLKDTVLAESSNSMVLHETGLKPRYYLPPTSVNWEALRESKTRTFCPYKGTCEYWDVVGENDAEVKDAVWCYRWPGKESLEISGMMCFWDEKVDVVVEGV